MRKIIFLGSGGGGNLKFINEYSQVYCEYFSVIAVITDRKCGASEYASLNGIPYEIMSFNREENEDNKLIDYINKFRPDYIITNVHKILSKKVVSEYRGKLLNLHYSYLPAFGGVIGMEPVEQAIKRNNLFIGCTMHYVEEEVDSGDTIAQGFVIFKASENIYQSVFECGAITLLSGLFTVSGRPNSHFKLIKDCLISPFSLSIDIVISHQILIKLKSEQ